MEAPVFWANHLKATVHSKRFKDVPEVMAGTPGSFEGRTIAADNDLFELKEKIGRGGMGVPT